VGRDDDATVMDAPHRGSEGEGAPDGGASGEPPTEGPTRVEVPAPTPLTVAGIALATTPVEDPRLAAIAIGVYAIYVLCVTILGSYEDLRLIPQRAARSIQTIPPIAAALVILICPSPWPAAAVAIALALAFQIRVARIDKAWDQASIRTSMGYLLLGTQLYTALLAMAHDRPVEAFGIVAAAAAARYAMRRYPLT